MKRITSVCVLLLISTMLFAQCYTEPTASNTMIISGGNNSLNFSGTHTLVKSYGNGTATVQNMNWNGGGLSLEGKLNISANVNPGSKKLYIRSGADIKVTGSASFESNTEIFVAGKLEFTNVNNANGSGSNYPTFRLKNNTAVLKINGTTYTAGTYQIGQNSNNKIKVINAGCNDILPIKFGTFKVSINSDKDFVIEFETTTGSNTKQFNVWVSADAVNRVQVAIKIPENGTENKYRFVIPRSQVNAALGKK